MPASSYTVGADPTTGEPLITLSHGEFGLGLLPSKVSANYGLYPMVSVSYPDIAESQWTDQDFESFCVPVQDQGRSSACGPFSLKEVLSVAYSIAFGQAGQAPPDLSAWFAYGVITKGRDIGTSLPDLLNVAQQVGLPPNSLVNQGDFSGNYPQSVYDAAKNWKIESAYNALTLANICSCMERRQGVLIGVDIGDNFNPDANGVLPPFQQGAKILGHAMSVVGKKKINGLWYPKVRNHWRYNWGIRGCGYLHPSYVNPQFGAWCVRAAALNPNDPNAPPAVP